MRLLSCVSPTSGLVVAGIEHAGLVYTSPLQMTEVIARGHDFVRLWGANTRRAPFDVIAADKVNLAAPVPEPPSVRDFMAFERHALDAYKRLNKTLSPVWYEIPAFYFTNPAAILPASGEVTIPPMTNAFDYEVEIAAIIGRPGGDIAIDEAAEHIAGYTIFVDWSSRDLQQREVQVGLGPAKAKDAATSLGPVLVTPDELADRRAGPGFDLATTVRVNGVSYGSGNWSDIHWSFEEMISYASRGTHLRTGDVFGSGTVGGGSILELPMSGPAAVSSYLRAGDRVEIEIERLGVSSATIRPPKQRTERVAS